MENNDIFRYATPESVGIPSARIEHLFRKLVHRRFLSHSLVVIRHGKIIGEGYFAPFQKNDFHRMYSTSKTFVATAIGMLIGEGKLSLDSRVIDFFPEKVNENTSPYLKEATIRDLLTMATPYAGVTYSPDRDDWVDSFFTTPTEHAPGCHFKYDTAGSFILDVIVEKLTGKPFMDYLYDVLLKKTGFSEGVWCVNSPDGYSWGGSGVQCTTLDLARLGQIYLNKGMVNGEQLLPRWYAEEAVSRQIDNNTDGTPNVRNGWGYGYQIWCMQDGGFTFWGMGGQVVLAFPRLDLMLVATSDMQGCDIEDYQLAELFYNDLIERIDEAGNPDTLPEDPAAYASLKEYTAHLSCPVTVLGEKNSPVEKEYFGKTFTMDKNPMGIETLRFEREGDRGAMFYRARGEEKKIVFGMGEYVIDTFPETSYFGKQIRTPKGEGYRCMTAALWAQENKFCLRCYLIDDYFGNMMATFTFKNGEVIVFMRKTAEWFLDEYEGTAVGKMA